MTDQRLPAGTGLYTITAIATLLLTAGSVYAQAQRPERPYRGLFAGGTGTSSQDLTVHGSLGASYDDNLLAAARGNNQAPRPNDLNTTHRGMVGSGSAGLTYALNRSRFSVNAIGQSSEHYYPSFGKGRDFIRRDSVSVGADANLGRGFSAGASTGYQPYSLAALLPSVLTPRSGPTGIDDTFPSSDVHFISYLANLAFARQLSARTSFSLDTAYRAGHRSNQQGGYASQSGGASLSHHLTRDLSLDVGYHYTSALYRSSHQRPVNHAIDAGVNYSRSLSISRRTQVSFGSGTSAARSASRGRTRFHLTGHADLTHEIGRTWSTAAIYSRGVVFSEAWPEPLLSDGFTFTLGGLLTSRLHVDAAAGGSHGGRLAGGSSTNGTFGAYTANVSSSYAINRYVSGGVSLAYYHHQFGDVFELTPGFPNGVNRRSLGAHISLWAPVFGQTRRR